LAALFRPQTLDDALAMARPGLTLVAGCTDLFPATQAQELAGDVLDVTGIAELRGIVRGAAGWRIGAAATWTDVLRAELPPAFDGLKNAAREVGSVQIQNAGTVGGNICNASPAADGIPCLMTLDAEVELASAEGRRRMPLGEFVTGPRQTALRPGEVMVAVHVPETAGEGRGAFVKLGARRYLVISIAMAAARIVVAEGRIAAAALSVGACGPVAVRLAAQEAALIGLPPEEAAAAVAEALVGPALSPIDDVRADRGYRRAAAAEIVARAVAGTCR
jgi:CO/xanthine dehydrogenase FAD-binding subunit